MVEQSGQVVEFDDQSSGVVVQIMNRVSQFIHRYFNWVYLSPAFTIIVSPSEKHCELKLLPSKVISIYCSEVRFKRQL